MRPLTLTLGNGEGALRSVPLEARRTRKGKAQNATLISAISATYICFKAIIVLTLPKIRRIL